METGKVLGLFTEDQNALLQSIDQSPKTPIPEEALPPAMLSEIPEKTETSEQEPEQEEGEGEKEQQEEKEEPQNEEQPDEEQAKDAEPAAEAGEEPAEEAGEEADEKEEEKPERPEMSPLEFVTPTNEPYAARQS